MSEIIDRARLDLNRWMTYVIAKAISDDDDDRSLASDMARAHVRLLGTVLRDIEAKKPGRFPLVPEFAGAEDPFHLGRAALAAALPAGAEIFPEASFYSLLEVGPVLPKLLTEGAPGEEGDAPVIVDGPAPEVLEGAAPLEAAGDAGAEEPARDAGEPTAGEASPAVTPGESPVDPVWNLAAYLTRVECVRETDGLGADKFVMLGNWTYGDESGATQAYSGSFDTGTRKSFQSSSDGNGLLLCHVTVKRSTDKRNLLVTLGAFEDDGMSASDARTLATIIGGLATLGVNALLQTATVQGTPIPAAAREAYTNLGLPGLIGVLSDLFGPDPFLPIEILATTTWPGGAAKPQWTARITHPRHPLGEYVGEGRHSGTATYVEAELREQTLPNGTEVHTLVGMMDEGQYLARLDFVMSRG